MIGNSYIKKNKRYLASKDFLGEQGVTLIELLVAVGIFALVMSTTIVVFSSTIKDQQAVKARLSLIDNTRYVLDFMNKELRMAKANPNNLDLTFASSYTTDPLTGKIIPSGLARRGNSYPTIVFINSAGNTIRYSYSSTLKRIYRWDASVGPFATANFPISSAEINLTDMDFIINDWDFDGPNPIAPIITIYVKAERTGSGGTVNLELQSTVSPRLY